MAPACSCSGAVVTSVVEAGKATGYVLGRAYLLAKSCPQWQGRLHVQIGRQGRCTHCIPGERSSLRHALSTDTGIASRSTPSQYARSPESFTMSCVLGLYLSTSEHTHCHMDVQIQACHADTKHEHVHEAPPPCTSATTWQVLSSHAHSQLSHAVHLANRRDWAIPHSMLAALHTTGRGQAARLHSWNLSQGACRRAGAPEGVCQQGAQLQAGVVVQHAHVQGHARHLPQVPRVCHSSWGVLRCCLSRWASLLQPGHCSGRQSPAGP